jgi:antirestriction protein ArdC
MSKKVAEIVTQRLIAQIEAGVNPWRMPWAGVSGAPINHARGYHYRGINHIVLSLVSMMEGYKTNRYITFNQVKALGLRLEDAKGKGVPVIFYKMIEKKDDAGEVEKSFPIMRYTSVFNIDLVPGIEWETPPPPNGAERVDCAEQIISQAVTDGRLPEPDREGYEASYNKTADTWQVPPIERFYATPGYYGTVFHEAAHATGHETRLARDMTGSFGSPRYAKEEAIAEMCSTMMLVHCGIDIQSGELEMSASYLAGWLPEIKKDPRILTRAASDAQKAMDWLLGTSFE